jgi:hypothetical protein
MSWVPKIVDRHWLYARDPDGQQAPVCLAYLDHHPVVVGSLGKTVHTETDSAPVASGLEFDTQADAIMFTRAANRLLEQHYERQPCNSRT